MKNFALTAATFTGDITFGYDNQNRLISFTINGELTDKQHTWILQNLPLTPGLAVSSGNRITSDGANAD